MKRFIFRIIKALHTAIVRTCLVRHENVGCNVKLHTICGKWMAGAHLVGYEKNPDTQEMVLLKTPYWAAFVFTSGPTVEEKGFATLAEAEVAMYRLARKHLGRRFIVPREWWPA